MVRKVCGGDAMRIVEMDLLEMPQKIPPTIFDFEDDAKNREFTAERMKKISKIIEDNENYSIVGTGDGYHGWYLLFNKETKLSDYAVQYEFRNWNWINGSVTQCVLWRRVGSIFTRDITKRMFFSVLLPKYGAIMSDRQQTDNGHNFWIDRLADAVARNLRVGLADTARHMVDWYDGTHIDVVKWTRQKDAFKEGEKYQDLRYVIVAEPRQAGTRDEASRGRESGIRRSSRGVSTGKAG